MAHPEQTFANHRQRSTMWLVAGVLAVLGFSMTVWFALQQPGIVSVGFACLALAVVLAVTLVRRYALRLQDRIIRLEMQVRCARLGVDGGLHRLTLRQIVALRFASDAELPALLDRAVAESLTPDQIKRAVTSWQGDYLRV